jgi:hypothetical protein
MRRQAAVRIFAPRGQGDRRRQVWLPAGAVVLAAVLAGCGASTTKQATSGRPTPTPTSLAATPLQAPNGALTLLNGTATTISAFRGSPTLVWFVAGGCASCAASIPAVAQHFPAFAQAKTRILVLGLYGAFDPGAQGAGELASFGQAAAGAAFADRTWTWGLASAGLTAAYDPGGVPDEYFLLDAGGQEVYRGSVPVSTMGALLAHLQGTGAAPHPGAGAAVQPAASGTLP